MTMASATTQYARLWGRQMQSEERVDTYKEHRRCCEDEEDLRLKFRVYQALSVDLSLFQAKQSHKLCSKDVLVSSKNSESTLLEATYRLSHPRRISFKPLQLAPVSVHPCFHGFELRAVAVDIQGNQPRIFLDSPDHRQLAENVVEVEKNARLSSHGFLVTSIHVSQRTFVGREGGIDSLRLGCSNQSASRWSWKCSRASQVLIANLPRDQSHWQNNLRHPRV